MRPAGVISAGAAFIALRQAFAAAGVAEAEADARALLTGITGLTALDLVREPDAPLGQGERAALEAAMSRRLAGEPVGRILGRRRFWDLDFALSPGTLEPRHDSEAVIEEALDQLGPRRQAALRILDLGTGTGCLLLALLQACPRAIGIGVDLSEDAARTAARNAATLGFCGRVLMVRGGWAEAVGGPFDLVMSNPPYIARDAMAELADEVRRHDPALALDGGPDGLEAYRALIPTAKRCLATHGRLILEIGAGQEEAVSGLAHAAGLAAVGRRRDLGGHVRALAFAQAGQPAADHRDDMVSAPASS